MHVIIDELLVQVHLAVHGGGIHGLAAEEISTGPRVAGEAREGRHVQRRGRWHIRQTRNGALAAQRVETALKSVGLIHAEHSRPTN